MGERRGRPPALPQDGTAFDGPAVDVPARLGWLLRVNRLASADPDNRSVATFARRLRSLDVTADGARVSRWETGVAPASADVVAGYETVLGLPAGALRSVGAGLAAVSAGGAGPAPAGPLPDGAAQTRLDAVYAQVAGPAPAGGDWLDLAGLLTGPDRILLPGPILEDLLARLLDEMMRAAGTAYTTRFQALTRLITAAPLTGAVAAAIGAAVSEGGAQCVIDAVSLLGEVGDARLVRRLLASFDGGPGPVATGAAHALLNQLITGSFPAGELAALEAALRRAAADDPAGHGRLALMVGARLSAVSRQRAGLPPAAPRPLPAAPAGQAPVELWQRLELGRFLAAGRDATGLASDPMLARLLGEAMASRHVERRHHASLLLLVSPYRSAVAGVACRVAERADSPAARRGAGALLWYLAGPAQVPVLRAWAAGDRPDLRQTALTALAHAGAGGAVGAGVGGGVDSAAVYAAGMTGDPVLRVLAAEPGTPAGARRAARWWLRHGPAVLDGVGAG
jgi:hypothetical protein